MGIHWQGGMDGKFPAFDFFSPFLYDRIIHEAGTTQKFNLHVMGAGNPTLIQHRRKFERIAAFYASPVHGT